MEDSRNTVFADDGLLFLAIAAETVEKKENISSFHFICESKKKQHTSQKQTVGYTPKSTANPYANTNASISNLADKTKSLGSYSREHSHGYRNEPIDKSTHSYFTFKDESIQNSRSAKEDNANAATTSKRNYDRINNNVSNNSISYDGTEIFSYNMPSLGICSQNNYSARKSSKYTHFTHAFKYEQSIQRAPSGIHDRNDCSFVSIENRRKTSENSKIPESLTTHNSKNDDDIRSPEMLEASFLELKKQNSNLQRFICNARKVSFNHTFKTGHFIIDPDTTAHGTHLVCSHQQCAAEGIKFQYCAFCKVPAAAKNFARRHRHT